MKPIRLYAAGFLLLSIAMPGFAGEGHKGCDGMRSGMGWHASEQFDGRGLRHLGKALALTDAQKDTLKTQREANKASRDALQTRLFDARKALASAVDRGASDAELTALAETLGKLHAEQALAGANSQKAFLAVLTDEQKQTLVELKAKRMEHKEHGKSSREPTEG